MSLAELFDLHPWLMPCFAGLLTIFGMFGAMLAERGEG